MPLIILIPLGGAVLPAVLARWLRIGPARTASLLALIALLITLGCSPAVLRGGLLIESWPWIPAAGLAFALRLDGLSLLFAVLIMGIGLLVFAYARYYLGPDDPRGRFYGFMLLFMGSMLGVVLAENLLLLAIFWELTSLASFLLIGFRRLDEQARRGARLALIVTGAGGLALLGGMLLLGHAAGSFELEGVLAAGPAVKASPAYLAILFLLLAAAFTKSAQFPFHFWLPPAMAAPTPVSAYLHSATMVMAGIYLLARLFPVLSGTEPWFFTVSAVGLATLLIAAYIAHFRHDLKGLLAYSTASHLGLITLLFGIGTPLGAVAAVFHTINHAVFKSSLFMSAGIIEHETGTRDMRRLSGLARYMPRTAALALVAAGAMAGVPLLNGFLSKEMFFAETFEVHWLGDYRWIPPILATLAGVLTVAYSARFVHDVFFGPPPVRLTRMPHDPPIWMRMPVIVLAGLCLVVGLAPQITVRPVLDLAAQSVLQHAPPAYGLRLWQGLHLPQLMSFIALVGGTAVYAARRYLFDLHGYSPRELTGQVVVERLIRATIRAARALMPRIVSHSLQRYTLLLLLTALALGCAGAGRAVLTGGLPRTPLDPLTAALTAVLIAAALATARLHRRRLEALVCNAVVGLTVTLAFVRFSAPDVALAQLLVEIVTMILMLLVMFYLPQHSPRESSVPRRVRDIAVAAAIGAAMAALAWMILTRPHSSVSSFYLRHALTAGGGANVVNVILVDFRAFDTLGEITVLSIAAAAIVALLAGLRPPFPASDWLGRAWARDRHPLMLSVVARPLLPLALLVSIYLFLRGHNAPGGGFIAGLAAGTAIVLQYMALGVRRTRALLPDRYMWLLGAGLGIAALTGFASLVFGSPFLTSALGRVRVPLVGAFELASALAFDLGVFLVVVGTVLGTLATLGQVVVREEDE